jgi:hypothetical protein
MCSMDGDAVFNILLVMETWHDIECQLYTSREMHAVELRSIVAYSSSIILTTLEEL